MLQIMIDHPYIRYSLALIGKEYEEVSNQDLINQLNICLGKISLEPSGLQNDDKIEFRASGNLPDSKLNRFQAPYVLSSDVKGLYKNAIEAIRLLEQNKSKSKCEIKQSLLPISKEYVRFSDNGGSKVSASISLKDYALLILTTLTEDKPCMAYFDPEKKKWIYNSIFPDISLEQTKCFISVFKRIREQKCKDLLKSRGKKKEKKLEFGKPNIYNGNFPNSVKSSALKVLSVLGAIGELKKDLSDNVEQVLEGLRDNPLLIISSIGQANTVSINNHIIDIAKDGELHKIVDSLYYAKFYMFKGLGRIDYSRYESYGVSVKDVEIRYETYDYYLGNFLVLFNHHSFAEFLACRMEYPITIKILFYKYFITMESINKEIIESAESLGSWLNSVAYIVAKREVAPQCDWSSMQEEEKVRLTEKKYKFLVELESSIFSATDSISLISHTIARAGRMSESDAPSNSLVFVKAAMNGEISVDVAKNLLIAFSRIKAVKTLSNEQSVDLTLDDSVDCENI